MDLSRLPVGEAIIGFLVTALVVTFVLAFTFVDVGSSPADEAPDGNGGEVPTPVEGAIDIVLNDNFFEPTDFTIAAGETVSFNLDNQGIAIHNMHISVDGEYALAVCEPGGDAPCSDPNTVSPGATAVLEWDVPADAAGMQIPFRCDFHPVEMTGTITVQ
jgi:plastocyanin